MSNSSRVILLAVFSSLVGPLTANAAHHAYRGICEASAAALVDKSHVAVASDDFSAIMIYQRGKPKPVTKFAVDDVTDIEGSARVGDTIFWLTSHSLNSSGEDKKKRKELLATAVSADGTLSNSGEVYRNLRADMAAALGSSEDSLKTHLNIEGLAATPEGHLLIGLRGPLSDNRAIVLELANPMQLVKLGTGDVGSAQITPPVMMDLSDGPGTTGRGVRDIALVGNRYLVLAGSEPDGGNPPPKLFWWDGNKEGRVTPGPEVDFKGMTPEAIVVWNDQEGEILSDSGGALIKGVECADKDPPKDAFFPTVDLKF
ncbi:DUF3616 domain-containing protein [Rhizobium sp. 1399]|jgi:hypothetical protein|uniref:DUF3616 domain-containing protein n=1 Tax=Rhizobium sp. 1399 TaxID=2817758 RepID=UPI002864621C|nr:DUF3616 domain-containing protein [Rhizobium sp. 1399]MDR6668920.1 hypothetical protein [Rhizobium sp. 1399]